MKVWKTMPAFRGQHQSWASRPAVAAPMVGVDHAASEPAVPGSHVRRFMLNEVPTWRRVPRESRLLPFPDFVQMRPLFP